jgi:hypothetical protein
LPRLPTKEDFCPIWFAKAAEYMVRNRVSIKEAAFEIGHALEPAEITRLLRRKDFQEILRVEENRYFASVANDPSRTKSVALGRMWVSAEALARDGEHDKAVQALERISKVEGWIGPENNVNIFAGLTAKEIENARKELEGKLNAERKDQASLPN